MKLVTVFLQLIAAIDEHYCNSTELGFKGDLENCFCPNGFHLAHLAAYKESLQFFHEQRLLIYLLVSMFLKSL